MKYLYILLLFTGFSGLNAQESLMNIYKKDGTVVQYILNTVDSVTYTVGVAGVQLTTTPVTGITTDMAVTGGTITNDGGIFITKRGICIDTAPNPTVQSTSDGTGSGAFTSTISSLYPQTVYYVRAYAVNPSGVYYGNEISFTTEPPVSVPGAGVTDIDGNTYPSIVVGNGQEWMAQDLAATHFSNGDNLIQFNTVSEANNSIVAGWAYPAFNAANGAPYGKMYNGYTITDSRNVCPTAWHPATSADWYNLIDYVGGDNIAGKILKEAGSLHWDVSNVATNQINFNAIPSSDNFETSLSNSWAKWFGSLYVSGTDVELFIMASNESMQWDARGFNHGAAIRCVKD